MPGKELSFGWNARLGNRLLRYKCTCKRLLMIRPSVVATAKKIPAIVATGARKNPTIFYIPSKEDQGLLDFVDMKPEQGLELPKTKLLQQL